MTGALNGKTITSIVAGDDYTLAISNDGKLYSYGQNSQCILGDGNAQSYLRLSPEKVVFPTEMQERSVLSVSTSDFGHAIAITDDRKLWGWGNNFVGQVGNGNTTNVCLPVPVITDGLLFGKLFSAVAAGNGFTIALATTGELFAWGLNNAGQLGDGTYIDRLLPVAVNMTGVLAGRRVLSVSSGADHTVAVTDDGKLFSWGRNHAQQSSDGSKIDSVPVAVNMSGALKGMTPSSVYARCNLVMMITTSGRLYAWGAFFPMTTYKYYTEPTEIVIVPGKTVLSVSMSCVQISVVISDGSMYAWGIIGTVSKKSIISETPVRMDIQLLLGKTVSSVSVGYIHKTVLSNEGKIYEYLYDRMIDQENTLPTSVDMSGVLKGKTILGIALGLAHTLAIADDNMVYSWGLNNVGQLGDGTNLNRYTPVAVNASGFLAGKTVLTVAAGLFRSFALTSEGKLYSWGNNDNGYLGDGTIITQKTPVPAFTQGLLAGKIISGISTDGTIIISEGKMYRWNAFSKKPEAVPTGTLGNKTILSVSSTEHHTVILASDGSVYAYGSNYYGQLGDGTSKDKMEPVEIDMTGVMKGKRVTSIAVGAHFTVALTHDFGIYYWGSYNGFDRDTFSPTAVNINMGTAKPQQIVAGGGTAMLLLDDGRLYSWGVANFGFSTIVASPALVSTNSSTVGVFKPMIAAGTTSSIYFVPRGCETGYTGYECSYPMCWGKNSTDSMVCNGQGTCSAYNTCDCNKYFTGSECKEWTLTSGMIFLGISLSVIIITGLLIGLPILFMYTRYRRRFTKQQQVETEMKDLLEQSLIRADALSEKIDRDWIISFDDLKFLEKLSEGSFGVVFKGRYKCADVAIKVIKDFNASNTESFEHEVRILRSLRHPNILLFMGVALNEDNRFIVTELMPGNSLESVINRKGKQSSGHLHNAVSFGKKVDLLLGITRGMSYLHGLEPAIIHRDLKPGNILLDKTQTVCKVADFGTASMVSNNTMTGNVGTVLYMAPEILINRVQNDQRTKVDVYSFGIILHELFFEEQPYRTNEEQFDSIIALGNRVVGGLRPAVPEYLIDGISAAEEQYLMLMKQCWDGNPEQRPSFDDILSKLLNIEQMM